jgi:hypothetical protein
MERFTVPDEKPFLESWLENHPPPDLLGQEPSPKLHVSIERDDGKTADVVVQIAAKDKRGMAAHYVLRQRWVAQGGDWYFRPREAKNTLGAAVKNTGQRENRRR